MFDIPLHRLIIHFPIALTIIALIYDAWGSYSNRLESHDISHGLMMWASVSSLAAVITGLQLAGISRIESGVITGHAGFGIMAAILATALGVWRYSARARNDRSYPVKWLVLGAAAAFLVAAAAVTGHRLSGY